MIKRIVQTGGKSIGVRFTVDERIVYGLKEGDVLDFTIFKVDVRRNENVRKKKTTTKRGK